MRATHTDDHLVVISSRGARRCRTCWRGEDDLDEVAVARAVEGDRAILLTPAERGEAVGRLRSLGLLQREIAVRLGVTPRTVERHLALLRARSTA